MCVSNSADTETYAAIASKSPLLHTCRGSLCPCPLRYLAFHAADIRLSAVCVVLQIVEFEVCLCVSPSLFCHCLPLSISLWYANSRPQRTVTSRGKEAYPLAVSSSQSKAHQKAETQTRNAGGEKQRGAVIQLTHPYVRIYMCPDSTIYASAHLWYNPRPPRPLHTHAQPAGTHILTQRARRCTHSYASTR